MEKATDKQIKFIIDLAAIYFVDCNKRLKITEAVKNSNNLSKRDASTIIRIMKADVDLQKEAWSMCRRGLCNASSYYAGHCDIYDTSDEETLNAIFARL